jgi:simple sugar transport system ATP-binding protein
MSVPDSSAVTDAGEPAPQPSRPPRLELIGITRRYPGTVANRQVSLRVAPGEIHAILGENGSGKSTLMRCIYGLERPDEGAILWNGREVAPASAAAGRALGMAMVFQHFSLIEPLSVLDNVVLYLRGTALAKASDAEVTQRLQRLCSTLDMPLDLHAHVEDLSVGERQRIEILRCLLLEPSLLMLDEPTAALTPAEADQLFGVLRRIAAEGCSILFVTHRLAEVRALCTRATVLRRGSVAGSCDPSSVDEDTLARLLVGELPPALPSVRATPRDEVRLRLDALVARRLPEDAFAPQPLDLAVRAGEIVGIAGVAGNGQSLLADLVSGERTAASGQLHLCGEDHTRTGPRIRQLAGLQAVPAERTHRGAVAQMALHENLLLTHSARYTGDAARMWSRIDRPRLLQDAATIIERHDVRTTGPDAKACELSGGNLQKFLIGRALLAGPRFIVCQNPTWGVDIAAAAAIHRCLLEARDAGAAILLISADLEEIYGLADRVAVLFRGRLSDALVPNELPMSRAGLLMAGAGDAHGAEMAST